MANLSKCTSELILLFIFNEEIHLRYWIFISDKSRFYIKRIYRKIYVGFFAFFDEYYKILFFLIFCDRDNHINKFYMIVFISFLAFSFSHNPIYAKYVSLIFENFANLIYLKCFKRKNILFFDHFCMQNHYAIWIFWKYFEWCQIYFCKNNSKIYKNLLNKLSIFIK